MILITQNFDYSIKLTLLVLSLSDPLANDIVNVLDNILR